MPMYIYNIPIKIVTSLVADLNLIKILRLSWLNQNFITFETYKHNSRVDQTLNVHVSTCTNT